MLKLKNEDTDDCSLYEIKNKNQDTSITPKKIRSMQILKENRNGKSSNLRIQNSKSKTKQDKLINN